MKKLGYLITGIIFCFGCSNDDIKALRVSCLEEQYIYEMDKKTDISSELLSRYILVGFDKDLPKDKMRSVLRNFDESFIVEQVRNSVVLEGIFDDHPYMQVLVSLKNSYSCSDLDRLINSVEEIPEVVYSAYTYDSDAFVCCTPSGGLYISEIRSYANDFVVEVKDEGKINGLMQLVQQTNTQIVKQLPVPMKNTFILRVNKTSMGNALEMSNYFYESKLFNYTDPNSHYFDIGPGDVPLKR